MSWQNMTHIIAKCIFRTNHVPDSGDTVDIADIM